MYTIHPHPYDKDNLSIKTNLSHYAIIAYTEKIVKIKEWKDTMTNRGKAKIILDCMVILEHHTKKCLLTDFDELYAMLFQSTRNN